MHQHENSFNLISMMIFQLTGYSLTILCFTLQTLINYVCENSEIECKIFIKNIFLTCCIIATILVWRGLWMYFDMLTGFSMKIFTSNSINFNYLDCKHELIYLIFITSWILLILTRCSNSLQTGSILRDDDADCIKFQQNHITRLKGRRRSDGGEEEKTQT